ncbi:hypothetical protein FKP32DRAFT_1595452 [Trametes sanguinea]|nr:hypothetical protein FKP32DRAFT_1595452 [Trametes sanguinea]
MSSSHSSARPTPKWRSSLSSKRHRPATSVSLVFAQPEQGSKLASAIDKLPATVLDDAASFMSQASRKRERTQSEASSFVSRIDQQEEQRVGGQVVQQQTEDVSRKRSKLSLDVHADTSHPIDQATQGQAADSPDPSANPVAVTDSPQAAPAPQESPTTKEEPKLDAGAKADDNSSSLLPKINIPFPGSEPQKTIRAAKSSPARSSWFGFSRAKADESSSSALEPSDNSAGERVTDSPSPISPQVSVTATPPQAIPASAGPMSFTPAQYSPPNHRLNSNATSISSVDEEVPRLQFTSLDNTAPIISPQAIVESQVAKAVDRKPSITSLNPTASRFTLKLPLLGRPKIPLEHAVAVAQAEDIREPLKPAEHEVVQSGQANETSSELPSQATNNEVAQGEPAPSSSRPDISPQTAVSQEASPPKDTGDAVNGEGANTHEQRPSSWWDYLGWSGHQSEDHTKPSEPGKDHADRSGLAEAAHQPSAPPSQVVSAAQAQEPPKSPQASAVPEAEPEQTDESAAKSSTSPTTQKTVIQDDKSAAKPASVFSAETVKSHGSAWYSPWAWYSSSPAPGSASQVDAGSSGNEGPEVPKTESEIVKEQALAREKSTEAEASSSPAKAPASAGDVTPKGQRNDTTPKAASSSPEPANPIESSLAENKSGWMSFLMSKALTIKSVTNESHDQKDDGMEVMDIDDEPQASAAIAIPSGNDVQRSAAASSPKAASPAPSSPQPPSTPKSPTGKTPAPPPPPKEREPRKPDPAEPLTESDSIKRETTKNGPRSPSPTPSKASGTTPPSSARPNFVLPTWEDTFHSPPRSYAPPRTQGAKSKLTGALSYVTGALFSKDERAQGKGKGKARETSSVPPEFLTFGQELPKALDVVGEELNPYILNGGCRVVVIGVAGWSPGAVTRTLAGGFAEEKGFKFKKITRMPLEGDGTIRKKVSRVYNHLVNNEEWMEDLHAADVIFVASHSQGAIISTHLIDRLIEDGHILTSRSVDVLAKSAAAIAAGGSSAVPTAQAQRVCLLALCGIHLGPLRYLKTSSLLQPYIQAKVVYIASLNDQVVPIYSGLFTAASHPRILRALYIDNDAYHSSDFLSNLLILLIRILNAGLSDRGLLAHLSEATAGTLSGVGHSTAYEELATYSLAVKYFFMTNDGTSSDAELVINPFNAVEEQNDYEIPWLLRDMIADTKVAHFFAHEFAQLRDAFDDWQPKTTILREVKKKLQPITRLSPTQLTSNSISKL